jgi:polar amino acid transport system permease protein
MPYLDFSGVLSRADLLWNGVVMTVQISLVAMAIALALGIVGAALALAPSRLLRFVAVAYVEVSRNTPFIVQLFIVYFGLPALGFRLTPIAAAIAAMAIYGGAFCIEIIRAGIQSIPAGQIESAKALGLSPYDIFRHVVLGPALASVFPSLSSQFVLLLLTSSVTSAVSVPELTGIGNDIQGMTLRNMEIYLVIAVVYVSLIAVLRGGMSLVERLLFPYKFVGR